MKIISLAGHRHCKQIWRSFPSSDAKRCLAFDCISPGQIQHITVLHFLLIWVPGWHKVPQTYAVLSRKCICRDLRAFSGVIFPSFDRNSNIFAIFIEQKSYGQNRKAFDRTENLSIEQKSYRQTFLSRKRAITTFLSRKFMITRSSIAFEDFLGSSIAPQVMPPWS